MTVAILLLSLILAMALGFAAHRSSMCTVLAVAEVLSTGRAHLLASFVKIMLWTLVVTLPLMAWYPEALAARSLWKLSGIAVAGGFVFGVGAMLNGGCAISTLWKLGNGQVRMLVTLAASCVGVWGYTALSQAGALAPHAPASSPYAMPGPWAVVLIAALGLWVVWEMARLWRTRRRGTGFRALVCSDFYRLSTAAALLGLSNGVLYALHGPWAYTNALGREIGSLAGAGAGPSGLIWGLFAAVVAGMAVSAWQRRSFALDWRPCLAWMSNAGGGLLMGLGAGMAAGGNDDLMLHGIPGFSPHALPAYLAMIAGIVLALTVRRRIQGVFTRVDVRDDILKTSVVRG
jgi:uncharacterized protein